MLRRNLLKSLMTIIPVSFLNKNIVANETNPEHTWEKTFKNKAGYPIRTEWSDGKWNENTYDQNNNKLTHKDSTGYWWEKTYNEKGQELTSKTSKGYWSEQTYDQNGRELTYKNSKGYMEEYVRDENGYILNHIKKGYVC